MPGRRTTGNCLGRTAWAALLQLGSYRLLPLPPAERSKTTQERTEYWDVGLPGFGVRVAASGRKTFTVRYTISGKQRRKDLGTHLSRGGSSDCASS